MGGGLAIVGCQAGWNSGPGLHEASTDSPRDAGHCGLHVVSGEQSVPCRGVHLGVAEKPADHGQALGERQRPIGKAAPEIVNSHVLKLRALADALPGPLQIGEVGGGELGGEKTQGLS